LSDGIDVWIDGAAEALPLFGLTGVERMERTLQRLGVPPERVELSGDRVPAGARFRDRLADAQGPVLALDGAALTDPRLVDVLRRAEPPLIARDAEGAALLLDPADAPRVPPEAPDLPAVADDLLAAGAPRLTQDRFDGFVAGLRRELPFYVRRATGKAQARALERWLFFANYKGSTDVFTRWVLPPLVWPITRWCAARRVQPSTVTWGSVLLVLAATWFFATGAFAAGLLCGWVFAVLDSVDGKLARVTLTDSRFGKILDHGLDIVHPPFWWLAWAWGLAGAGADPLVWVAGWAMVGLYIADRVALGVAKARFGRGLHAMSRLDARVRGIISRRNINLAILTVGLVLGEPVAAFYVVVVWQGATLVWHAARAVVLEPVHRPA